MQTDGTTLAQRLARLIDGEVIDTSRPPIAVTLAQRGSALGSVLSTPPSLDQAWRNVVDLLGTALLTDPSIVAAQHPGVTRSRLRSLLPDHLKPQIDHLLQWLDAAGVLAPPITPHEPFRNPRPLMCETAAELVERLIATPSPAFNNGIPTSAHVSPLRDAG